VAKTLQIRNVPDDVHRTVKTRAAVQGLSVSDYLLQEVTKVAERPSVKEVLERAASRPGSWDAGVEDVVAVIREDRGE
jgi:antitoxin FitA